MWIFAVGGGVWESNPPTGGLTRSTGFEVQGPHQQPNTSKAGILKTYAMVVKLNSLDCARKCARQLPGHFLQIGRVDDAIPVVSEFRGQAESQGPGRAALDIEI